MWVCVTNYKNQRLVHIIGHDAFFIPLGASFAPLVFAFILQPIKPNPNLLSHHPYFGFFPKKLYVKLSLVQEANHFFSISLSILHAIDLIASIHRVSIMII